MFERRTFKKKACVILLKQKKIIVVQDKWVENPTLYSETKVFYSPNVNDEANFETQIMFYFHSTKTACYYGCVNEKFGTYFKIIK